MTPQITVLAPAFYADPAHSTRYLRRSAQRHGIFIRWYGSSEPYKGWWNVQVTRLLAELKGLSTSHVLYTDSSDAIFLGGLDEIRDKYVVMGSPQILLSREEDGVNAGGLMGERLALIEALELIAGMGGTGDNPQEKWRELVAAGLIVPDIKIDHGCRIFQVTGDAINIKSFGAEPPRVFNTRTCSFPSILHFAGGYTDPIDGKAALIDPIWNQLNYNF